MNKPQCSLLSILYLPQGESATSSCISSFSVQKYKSHGSNTLYSIDAYFNSEKIFSLEKSNNLPQKTYEEKMSKKTINRRSVAKGAAWAAHVIIGTSTIPAYAVSPQPQINPNGRITWNYSWYPETVNNYYNFKVFTTNANDYKPGPSMCVDNTKSGQVLSQYVATFYLPNNGSVFSAGQYGTGGWSLLTQDTSKPVRYYNGVAYYPYTTVYNGSITAGGSKTCFPAFSFISQNGRDYAKDYYVYNSVLVDGKKLEGNYGPIPITYA